MRGIARDLQGYRPSGALPRAVENARPVSSVTNRGDDDHSAASCSRGGQPGRGVRFEGDDLLPFRMRRVTSNRPRRSIRPEVGAIVSKAYRLCHGQEVVDASHEGVPALLFQ